MLAIAEGEHTVGGVAGELVAEATHEDPARVALVAEAISTHLFATFKVNAAAWAALDNTAAAGDGTWSISSK